MAEPTTRTRVLRALGEGADTARALCSACKLELRTVQAHLANACKAGLVELQGTTMQKCQPYNRRSNLTAKTNVYALTDAGRQEVETA